MYIYFVCISSDEVTSNNGITAAFELVQLFANHDFDHFLLVLLFIFILFAVLRRLQENCVYTTGWAISFHT